MIILLIPIAIGYYWVTEYFRRSSREIQRLQSISASPIFSHFSETLNGVSTLRAFKLEKRFSSMILDKIDSNNQSQVLLLQINRWLSVRLAWIAVTVTVFTALSGVIGKALGISNPVIFGLAMTYAIPMVENLNWMVRCFTGTETNMTSVERLVQYQQIQREAARVRPAVDPRRGPDSWPRNGRIEFRDFQMKYRDDLPPVLKGINCTINAGEKVGICGRTGAGKSSILLALFRLVEACGGSIWIDGIDISTIGLARLRSSLSIIPQDPVLFTGSVRSNLDPFDEYTDDELWTVLRRCSMAEKISNLPSKLDTDVSENGSNFSVGERQLLCLARALCHKSRIILLDEATAAVDFETDKLIQDTVRKEFTQSTVLTIAHRINTIMDYDRIVVLEHGQVVEQGTPSELVANPETHFAQMVAGGA
jgi:ATP-binding cassette, subfamily C (CFTR/MRP), member 1